MGTAAFENKSEKVARKVLIYRMFYVIQEFVTEGSNGRMG